MAALIRAVHRKEVVSDPGGVEEIPVAAEYASVEIHDLVRHAEAREVYVPEQYGEVSTKNLISPERYEWRRVLCKPGTGTIRSGSSFQSSGHVGSGSTYSQGSTYSSGTTYSGGRTYSSGTTYTGGTPQYSGQTYGTTGTGINSGNVKVEDMDAKRVLIELHKGQSCDEQAGQSNAAFAKRLF